MGLSRSNYQTAGVEQSVSIGEDFIESLIRINEQWYIRKMDVLNEPELLDVLRAITSGAGLDTAIDNRVVQKLTPLLGQNTIPTSRHHKEQVKEN